MDDTSSISSNTTGFSEETVDGLTSDLDLINELKVGLDSNFKPNNLNLSKTEWR